MKNIGIGLLGFGTVGAGVVQGLAENADLIAGRLGIRLELRRIADLDLDTDRGVRVDRALLTRDARAVIDDPAVHIVIELIGGTGVARDLVLRALEAGKPVVTANKALLAEHGAEIFGKAAEKGVDIYFGASVGGGIPLIRALREGLIANRIDGICGILNGTCNYILTRMESDGMPFEEALADAQKQGYAEANPALDVDGVDTAHKAVVLASLAYGCCVDMENVHIEGIRDLSETDIRYAGDFGYRIKLLAVIKQWANDEVEIRVHPTLISRTHVLASINGVFNAAMVHGNMAGHTLYYGRGAGREPTASTVIADVADIARNLAAKAPCRVPAVASAARRPKFRPMGEVSSRYYLRLSLLDQPGVLAEIAALLGRQRISIASVLQKEVSRGDHVPVLIVTHTAKEKDIDAALRDIEATDSVAGRVVRLRIED